MNILSAHLRRHNTRVRRIRQYIRVRAREVLVQILRIQDRSQLAPSILAHRSQIAIQLVQGLKLRILRRRLVRITRQIHNPHLIAFIRSLLHQGQQVGCQDRVAHVVDRHMPVHAVVRELVGHDSAAGVVDEDIEAVCGVADLLRDLGDLAPVREVAFDPVCAVCFVCAKVLFDRVFGAGDDFLRDGEDEELADVFGEEGVCADRVVRIYSGLYWVDALLSPAISDAFRSSRHHSYLTSLVGHQVERKASPLWS